MGTQFSLSLKNVWFHAGGSCPPWETASLAKCQGVSCEGRTSCRSSISGSTGGTGQVASYRIIPAFTVGLLWMTVLYPKESANSLRNTFGGNELLSAWRERRCSPAWESKMPVAHWDCGVQLKSFSSAAEMNLRNSVPFPVFCTSLHIPHLAVPQLPEPFQNKARQQHPWNAQFPFPSFLFFGALFLAPCQVSHCLVLGYPSYIWGGSGNTVCWRHYCSVSALGIICHVPFSKSSWYFF